MPNIFSQGGSKMAGYFRRGFLSEYEPRTNARPLETFAVFIGDVLLLYGAWAKLPNELASLVGLQPVTIRIVVGVAVVIALYGIITANSERQDGGVTKSIFTYGPFARWGAMVCLVLAGIGVTKAVIEYRDPRQFVRANPIFEWPVPQRYWTEELDARTEESATYRLSLDIPDNVLQEEGIAYDEISVSVHPVAGYSIPENGSIPNRPPIPTDEEPISRVVSKSNGATQWFFPKFNPDRSWFLTTTVNSTEPTPRSFNNVPLSAMLYFYGEKEER